MIDIVVVLVKNHIVSFQCFISRKDVFILRLKNHNQKEIFVRSYYQHDRLLCKK